MSKEQKKSCSNCVKVDVCAIFRANFDLLRQFPKPTKNTDNPTDATEPIIQPEDLAIICGSYLPVIQKRSDSDLT